MKRSLMAEILGKGIHQPFNIVLFGYQVYFEA